MLKPPKLPVAETGKSPEDAQDAIAAPLLADLADEKAWSARFAETTEAQRERMAALTRREIGDEEPIPLDDVFPSKSSQPCTRA